MLYGTVGDCRVLFVACSPIRRRCTRPGLPLPSRRLPHCFAALHLGRAFQMSFLRTPATPVKTRPSSHAPYLLHSTAHYARRTEGQPRLSVGGQTLDFCGRTGCRVLTCSGRPLLWAFAARRSSTVHAALARPLPSASIYAMELCTERSRAK